MRFVLTGMKFGPMCLDNRRRRANVGRDGARTVLGIEQPATVAAIQLSHGGRQAAALHPTGGPAATANTFLFDRNAEREAGQPMYSSQTVRSKWN
jgi:hypothetical protein